MFYIKNTCFVESVFFIFYSFYNMWKGDDKYIVSDLVSVVEDNKKIIILQTCSFDNEYKNYSQKYHLVIGIST